MKYKSYIIPNTEIQCFSFTQTYIDVKQSRKNVDGFVFTLLKLTVIYYFYIYVYKQAKNSFKPHCSK